MGLIFGGIVLAWIAFLVPSFVARRDAGDAEVIDPMASFGDAVRYVARSSALTLAEQSDVEVSTPLTRRAARAEIKMMSCTAARRRRNVVLGLVALTAALGAGTSFGVLPWVAPVVGGVLLAGFLVLARFSVKSLNARLDARLAELDTDCREDTMSFEVPADLRSGISTDSTELSIEISAPIGSMAGNLWDPIPVTVPTYVSKPLVPRTVRTIDLSAPEPSVAVSRTPVVAEAPQADVVEGAVLDERQADAG